MGGESNGHTEFEIPKEGLAGVVKNEGPNFEIEVKKVSVPEIGAEDVLIKLNATGLCMSDVHFMLNDWDLPFMSSYGTICAGHEGAGVIVKVGERVKTLKVGQRAGMKPVFDCCHNCIQCKTGRDNYCPKTVHTGLHVDGTYKQYVRSPERYTVTIPDGVHDYVAAPVMCSASTIYAALKASGIKPGQWACFPGGGGGVGIQGVQLASAMGMRPVVVDTGAQRKALAESLGAEAFVDFKEIENPVDKVVEITDGGAHAVFVTAIQAYPTCLDYMGTRPGATTVCIGLPPKGDFHIDVDPTRMVFFGQSVQGSFVSTLGDIDETLDFAKRGKLHLDPTVVGLSKWNESVQKLKNGQVAGRVVVDFNLP
ncbi:Alcohol dehydrogenase 1 [Cytospora mali]|uniref:Alcohol dehydrogenase 1 n=1 Tax=Cytospora mali TaxID=578113 RepID=A0A194V0R4_CYTMA|nr:Alcohol dehydrogenase 1 [Valsa mali var. pyri (nom. inval.)]